jgi:hypothetical protein
MKKVVLIIALVIIGACVIQCSNPSSASKNITLSNQTDIDFYYTISTDPQYDSDWMVHNSNGDLNRNSTITVNLPDISGYYSSYLLYCKPKGGTDNLSISCNSGNKITVYSDGTYVRIKSN